MKKIVKKIFLKFLLPKNKTIILDKSKKYLIINLINYKYKIIFIYLIKI